MNAYPAQHVRIMELRPSTYKVEAIFASAALPKTVAEMTIKADREISYALVSQGEKKPLEFLFLSEYALGHFPIAPKDFVTVSFSGPLSDPSSTVSPMGVGSTAPRPSQGEPISNVTPASSGGQIGKPNPLPGYNGPFGCSSPMDLSPFDEAKKSIASKSFSDTKMELAKQVTKANCLLASQVRQLMSLFSFESQKLEFAKFAYDYTYDRGNYYTINDEFGFESSIRELAKFLDEK